MTPKPVSASVEVRDRADRAIPIISFFTGLGFLDLGFSQAGFNVIWHNEVVPWFVRGFAYGMAATASFAGEGSIENADSIVEVGPREIMREAFGTAGRPSCWGVIGGPPCPDFSVGGKNVGSAGSRGRLTAVFVDRILELAPTFFVFENVPGLLRTEKHRTYLMQLRGRLETKFHTDLKLLNALDFGVPQDRERLFIVGFNRKWARSQHEWTDPVRFSSGHWYPWPEVADFADAKRRFEWPRHSPFGGSPPRPEGIPDELMVGTHILDTEFTSSLPNGLEHFLPRSDKFWAVAEGDDSRKSFKRLHRWRYSPTAAYGNNEVHLHPVLPRRLTVREALRIQSVPDDYALPEAMPLSHKFKGIGNGVPVKLARALADSLWSLLRGGAGEAV